MLTKIKSTKYNIRKILYQEDIKIIVNLSMEDHELSNYEIAGIDYLIEIPTTKVSLLDRSKIEELYEKGYEITKKKIKEFDL